MGRIAGNRTPTIKRNVAWERARGATQEAASGICGCYEKTVRNWERGNDPDYWRHYELAWLSHVKEAGVEALNLLRSVLKSSEDGQTEDARSLAKERNRIAAASQILRHLEATMPTTLHARMTGFGVIETVTLRLPEEVEAL